MQLGRQLFQGLGSSNVPSGSKMCADCHTPSLTLDTPIFEIRPLTIPIKPPAAVAPAAVAPAAGGAQNVPRPTVSEPATPSLINPIAPERLPINREFERLQQQRFLAPERPGEAALPLSAPEINERIRAATARMAAAAPEAVEDEEPAYTIDLTNPPIDPMMEPVLSVFFPRLPAGDDARVEVPLFSDLRTHDMGLGLTDATAQPADAKGIAIGPRMFLTRPLWGVADTGPYLHDGRSLTLREAIRRHAVVADNTASVLTRPLDPSSEAYPVVRAFEEQFNDDERQAILEFLMTLRLPPDPPCEE